MTDKPNIILIVIDALRARNLGCFSGNQKISPNIDRVAENGALFEDAYCTWNTTDSSLTTILTGKYPVSHGITNHGDKVTEQDIAIFNSSKTKMLPEILKQKGYKNIAIDWMGRWFKRGFDYYGYDVNYSIFNKIKQYIKYVLSHRRILKFYTNKRKFKFPSIEDIKGVINTFMFTRELAEIQDAKYVTDSAINMIKKNRDKKIFTFIHYWDTHSPYHCPNEFLNPKSDKDKDILIGRYKGAVKYVDKQIGRLVKKLRKMGKLENTLMIITSDHGDSLTEHGIYFDHHGLYNETIHVPLILHYPEKISSDKRVKGFVQHTDLVPTILDIIDSNEFSKDLDGQSLMPVIKGNTDKIRPFIYSEESYVQKKRAIRNSNYKYIYATDGTGYCRYCDKVHQGPEELYDMINDPNELSNIVDEKREIADEMRNEIDRLVCKLEQKRNSISEQKSKKKENFDEKEMGKIKKKLKSLGYID
ncbi:MAG: sulfatase-like hydrolase/transferase [Atribacterota bacterium]